MVSPDEVTKAEKYPIARYNSSLTIFNRAYVKWLYPTKGTTAARIMEQDCVG
ncbi:MAG: hypothetical protein KZQ90_19385 [Candidatus Thiodiazotropha sp. (ex Codakia rugifera)]|nr:hypothetical protein [Candidatus Thiodiazotropha sp. (ex Codakia rugifera)]